VGRLFKAKRLGDRGPPSPRRASAPGPTGAGGRDGTVPRVGSFASGTGFGQQEGSPYLHGAQAPAMPGGRAVRGLPAARNQARGPAGDGGWWARAEEGTTLFRVGSYRRFCNTVKPSSATKSPRWTVFTADEASMSEPGPGPCDFARPPPGAEPADSANNRRRFLPGISKFFQRNFKILWQPARRQGNLPLRPSPVLAGWPPYPSHRNGLAPSREGRVGSIHGSGPAAGERTWRRRGMRSGRARRRAVARRAVVLGWLPAIIGHARFQPRLGLSVQTYPVHLGAKP
jgi:hypothetical protein